MGRIRQTRTCHSAVVTRRWTSEIRFFSAECFQSLRDIPPSKQWITSQRSVDAVGVSLSFDRSSGSLTIDGLKAVPYAPDSPNPLRSVSVDLDLCCVACGCAR
jgi:hypothetical protein